MSEFTLNPISQPSASFSRSNSRSKFTTTRLKKITQVGIKSIFSHGLRSLLTVLGIVIGVAAVIAMLAVSEGASFEAQQQFRDLGATNILLKSVKPAEVEESSNSGFGPPQAIVYGLTQADITTIRDTIPGVSNVIASRIVKKNVWNLGISINTDVVGTAVDYPSSRNYNLRAGRFFSETELRDHANVVVLSDEVANVLFPIDNPIAKSIKIDSDYYNVLGIMEAEGFSNLGQNQAGSSNSAPSRIFIPFTASKSRFGETTTRQTAGGMESETVELHEAIIQVDNCVGYHHPIHHFYLLGYDHNCYPNSTNSRLFNICHDWRDLWNLPQHAGCRYGSS